MNAVTTPSSSGCLMCGALDKPITGTMRDRRCSDQAACAGRIRARNASQHPQLVTAPKLSAAVLPIGRASRETPAEVMIALLQERAGISELHGPLDFSDTLSLPLAAIQGRYVCFGKSGSGKSNASAVIIESCFANNVPVGAIDTLGNLWGLRRPGAGAGVAIPILGGAHGDMPLDVDDAVAVAHLLSKGSSMLLDLSAMTREDQQSFACVLFREMLRVLRRPAHVVVEEAETICPAFTRSKTQFASQGAVSLFARQVRNFGVGWTFSTQRLPMLHPEVIETSNAFLAMQTTGDIAQRSIQREAKTRVGSAVASAILSELGQLPVGYAWLLPDPSLFGTEVGAPVRFRFRMRRSYDSTAVPRIGEPKAETPAPVRAELKAFEKLIASKKSRK